MAGRFVLAERKQIKNSFENVLFQFCFSFVSVSFNGAESLKPRVY